ncbi:Insect cuticle protein [Trinorchestia longiramus]|nr:Insect cuticle protein [Trinorchestia longiramus]
MMVKTLHGGAWIALVVVFHLPSVSRCHEGRQREVQIASQNEGSESAPRAKSPNYDFEYIVRNDPDGQLYGASENRNGDSTSGYYFVDLPDGRRQKVSYYVTPESGYVADISYEQINDISEGNSDDGIAARKPTEDERGLFSLTRVTLSAVNRNIVGASTKSGLSRGNDIQIQHFLDENRRAGGTSESDFSIESESKSVSSHGVENARQTQQPPPLRAVGGAKEHKVNTGSGITDTGVALPILRTEGQQARNFFWKSNRKSINNNGVQSSSLSSTSRPAGLVKRGDGVNIRESGYPHGQVESRDNQANIQGPQSQPIDHNHTHRQKGERNSEKNARVPEILPMGRSHYFSQPSHTQNIDAKVKDVVPSSLQKPFSSVKTIVRPLSHNRSKVIGTSVPDFLSTRNFYPNKFSDHQVSNFQSASSHLGGKFSHSLATNAYNASQKPTSSRPPVIVQQQSTFPNPGRRGHFHTGTQGTQNIFDYDSFTKSLKPEDFGRKISSKTLHDLKGSKYFGNDRSLSVSRLHEISAVSLPEKQTSFEGQSSSKRIQSLSGFGSPKHESLYTYHPEHGTFRPSFISKQPRGSGASDGQLKATLPVVTPTSASGFRPSTRIGVPLPQKKFPSSDRSPFSGTNVGIPLPPKRLLAEKKSFSSLSNAKTGDSVFRPTTNRLSPNAKFGSRISPGKLFHRKRITHQNNNSETSFRAVQTPPDRKSSSDIRNFGVPIPASTTAAAQRRAPVSTLSTPRPRLEIQPARRVLDFENVGINLPSFNVPPASHRPESSRKFQIQAPLTKIVSPLLPPPGPNRSLDVGIPLPVFQPLIPGKRTGTLVNGVGLAVPTSAPSFVIKSDEGRTSVGRPLPSDSSSKGLSGLKLKPQNFNKKKLFVQQLEPVSKTQLDDKTSIPENFNVPANFQKRNLDVASNETQHRNSILPVGISLPDVMMPPPLPHTEDKHSNSPGAGTIFASSSRQRRLDDSSSSSSRPDRRLDDSVFLEDDDSKPTRFGFNIQANIGPHMRASR